MCFPTHGGFGEGAEQWHFVALYIAGGARSTECGWLKCAGVLTSCWPLQQGCSAQVSVAKLLTAHGLFSHREQG